MEKIIFGFRVSINWVGDGPLDQISTIEVFDLASEHPGYDSRIIKRKAYHAAALMEIAFNRYKKVISCEDALEWVESRWSEYDLAR